MYLKIANLRLNCALVHFLGPGSWAAQVKLSVGGSRRTTVRKATAKHLILTTPIP
jgi:hypothetical protein